MKAKKKTVAKKKNVKACITFEQLKLMGACTSGYRKLRAYKGKDFPKNKPFPILDILKSNGLDDVEWVLEMLQLFAEDSNCVYDVSDDLKKSGATLPKWYAAYSKRVNKMADELYEHDRKLTDDQWDAEYEKYRTKGEKLLKNYLTKGTAK